MALFEDVFGETIFGGVGGGLLVGVGALVLGPVLLPIVGRVLRPVIKTAVTAGLTVYDAGREAVTEAAQGASEIVSESRAEMGQAGAATGEAGKERPKRTTP